MNIIMKIAKFLFITASCINLYQENYILAIYNVLLAIYAQGEVSGADD